MKLEIKSSREVRIKHGGLWRDSSVESERQKQFDRTDKNIWKVKSEESNSTKGKRQLVDKSI